MLVIKKCKRAAVALCEHFQAVAAKKSQPQLHRVNGPSGRVVGCLHSERWWGHSNPTFCNQIRLNFIFAFRGIGVTKTSYSCGPPPRALSHLVKLPNICYTWFVINCSFKVGVCAKNNLLKIRKSEKFTVIRANGEKAFDIEIPILWQRSL